MLDKNDPHYQYKRIAAAEDVVEQNTLLDEYIRCYKNKYRGEPIFSVDNIHFRHIKTIRQSAKEKSRALINHFFAMKDDWFEKQAYSLDCLVKNLHRVNSDYSNRIEPQRKMQGKLKMQFHCDACWQEFTLICAPEYDFLNVLVRCEPCTAANRPLKKISKEERRATVLKLGSAFPGVPWDTKRKDMIEEIKELL